MDLVAQIAKRFGVETKPQMQLAVLQCDHHIAGDDDCSCIVDWRMTVWGNLCRETKVQPLDDGNAIVYVFFNVEVTS